MKAYCVKCGISAKVKPLHCTGKIEQEPNFLCTSCLKKYEPGLYTDLKNDGHIDMINHIFKAINNKK